MGWPLDAVRTLIAAFDGAWQSMIASGAKLSDEQRELTRELLAKYIIEQARQGELDERRLRAAGDDPAQKKRKESGRQPLEVDAAAVR